MPWPRTSRPDAWHPAPACRPTATWPGPLGVTVGTVSRAYAEAERRGLTLGEVGRGTFVRGPAAAETYFYPGSQAAGEDSIEMGFAYPAPVDDASELLPIFRELTSEPYCPTASSATKATRAPCPSGPPAPPGSPIGAWRSRLTASP